MTLPAAKDHQWDKEIRQALDATDKTQQELLDKAKDHQKKWDALFERDYVTQDTVTPGAFKQVILLEEEYESLKGYLHQRDKAIKDSIIKEVVKKWEKEAQKWLDELSILDLEMVNSIVFHKLHSQKKEMVKMIEGMKFGERDYPQPPDTTDSQTISQFLGTRDNLSVWNLALDNIIKKLEG